MLNLNDRVNIPELMDDLEFNDAVIFQTLQELDKINYLLGGNRVTIDALNTVRKKGDFIGKLIHVADLGCGSGEMLKVIAHWAKNLGIGVKLTGIDANPYIINYALKHCGDLKNAQFYTENILSPSFKDKTFDIIICTLFLHHFEEATLISLLKQLSKQASVAIIINDIHRHWLAYYAIAVLTGFFSRSYMVKYDAKLSVRRAFKRANLEKVFKLAGLSNYSIRWKWAFRYQVIIDCKKA